MSDMTKRVVIGLVFTLLLVGLVFLGRWFYLPVIAIFTGLGVHEMLGAIKTKGYKPMLAIGYIGAAGLFILTAFDKLQYYVYAVLLVFLIALAIQVFIEKYNPADAFISAGSAFYPVLPILLLIPIRFGVGNLNGYLLALLLLANCITDVCAYFGGTLLGKHKLAPKLSPRKTIEGTVSGIIGGMLFVIAAMFVIRTWNPDLMPWYHYLVIGILGSSLSVVGDLIASSIKRYCGIKDFGSIMPGHGGILDRVDSLLLSAPVIYIYALIFLV